MKMRASLLQTSAACVLALTMAEPVSAQQMVLEEIVVTARKRDESLQDIPLSISAFSVDQLRDKGIDNVHELAEATPGFAMDRGFGRFFDRPVIRGQSSILGGRNASFFVDGVYVSNSVASTTIDSLERIEVLRGPQSAIYGRATFAGAINYITKRPSNEFEGQFNGRVGSHDDYKVSGWLSGPLVEDKLFYFVGANWDYYGGEWKNGLEPNPPTVGLFPSPFAPLRVVGPTRGDTSKLGDEETKDISAKLLFTPSETVEITLKASYHKVDDGHYARTLVGRDEHNCFEPVAGTATANSPGYVCGEIEARDPTTGKPRQAMLNIPDLEEGVTGLFSGNTVPGTKPGLQRETYRFLAETKFDVDDWEVVVRGAYNDEDDSSAFDGDTIRDRAISGLGILQSGFEDKFDDYSGEFRVASPQDGDLRGLGGVSYYHEREKERNRNFGAFAAPFAEDGSDFDINKVDNWAVFGQLEFDVSDQLTVAVEGRYNRDKIETIGSAGLNAEATFKSFTPRFTLDYQLNDESMVYALVAKGKKPGDINNIFFGTDISEESRAAGFAAGQDSVDEEKAWTYEVGTKNTLLDGRASFNVSAFYIDWTSQQLTDIITITDENGAPTTAAILINLGATEIWGGEVEAFWAPTDELSFRAGYALADTEIKVANDGDIALITGVDDPGLVNGGNASGNQLPKQPKHTLSTSATYRDALSADVDWFFTTDLNWESKRYTEVGNFSHTGDLYRMNMRLGIDAGNWKMTAFMNNVLNDLTANNILRFRDYRPEFGERAFNGQRWRGFFFNQPRGRDFGVTAQYNF